jgi:hypothetical protein
MTATSGEIALLGTKTQFELYFKTTCWPISGSLGVFFIEDMSNFSVLTLQYYHSDPHFISFRRFTHCRTPEFFVYPLQPFY